ncbi:MAG: guanylate kinase [Acidimicrobiales bacterium]
MGDDMRRPLILVVSGPGGAGKGTIVDEMLRRDQGLWLSRSWTTRARRPGEPADAYEFVTRAEFEQRINDGGFLEWTEFLGNLYGSPLPPPLGTHDIVLEIELDGARQVKARHPEAILVFVKPPSREEQQRRLLERGDSEDHVATRLRKAEEEERMGDAMADLVIVNDDIDRAVSQLLGVLGAARGSSR